MVRHLTENARAMGFIELVVDGVRQKPDLAQEEHNPQQNGAAKAAGGTSA